MTTSPLLPAAADPLPIMTDPDDPAVEAPLFKEMEPLAPVSPP